MLRSTRTSLRIFTAMAMVCAALGTSSLASANDGYYGRERYNDDGSTAAGGAGNAAQMGVRISSLEEQLRQLQGQVEQAGHQARQAQQQMQQMQKDTDFRLQELEQRMFALGQQAPAAATAPAPAAAAAAPAALPAPTEAAAEPAPAAAPAAAAASNLGPNEQYNQAFRLLNQSKYDEAYTGFKQFADRYPNDPLVGNAYYWMGETFYVRRNYTQAADHFRQGFEAMPKGPKSGDNLLKLAMSLTALNRNSEACIVLRQVVKDYTGKSSAVVSKANNEMSRVGCK
jgi:tol-pal system protein YbgF